MHLIAKAIRISHVKFHCNRLTQLYKILLVRCQIVATDQMVA